MHRSDRFGLVLALPGIVLATLIFSLLLFSKAVCDPFYEPNRLLDFNFLRAINGGVAEELGGSFDPPPRPALKLTRDLSFPTTCYRLP